MNQPLSCTVVLLQSLVKRRTVYLNMLGILKNLFMLDIHKRNISHNQGSSVVRVAILGICLLFIQLEMLWYPKSCKLLWYKSCLKHLSVISQNVIIHVLQMKTNFKNMQMQVIKISQVLPTKLHYWKKGYEFLKIYEHRNKMCLND